MKNTYLFTLLLITAFTQAQIVNIPDANFKNALVNTNCVDTDGNGIGDADADLNNDGEIQVSEAEAVLRLYVEELNIASLAGIQSFINLIRLDCDSNQLVSLDITQSPNLVTLRCSENQLTSLDVSQNANLEVLRCYLNQLTSLDITQNPNLLSLGFQLNQLTSIDLSQNLNLERLYCAANQLTSLDLSQNLNLEELYCQANLFTSLDLTQNLNLVEFYCKNSQLMGLNIKNGNNVNMTRMEAEGNPDLTCIQVDDETANYPDCGISIGWCKDSTTIYSENCDLGLDDYPSIAFTIFPNPTQDVLNIETQQQIETLKIYNLQGQLIKEVITSRVDVSRLNSGLYFVQVAIDGDSMTKQFIKE